MGKKLDYPLASFRKSIEIADAVDSLGGTCSVESCADKLNRQSTSGGYKITVSTAAKFGLIEIRKGTLSITDLYKQAKLSYTAEERQDLMRRAFFRPEVFSSLYQRFKGRELPNHIDKLMIREMGVEEKVAGRVAGYFIDGLKEFGLKDSSGKIPTDENNALLQEIQIQTEEKPSGKEDNQQKQEEVRFSSERYTVHITGPGLNHAIEVNEEEDLIIVNAVLNKIKKALKKVTEIQSEGNTQ
ncbi:MAG: hypothetical protein WKF91_19380 [Segetibacter sp.]